jgi:hypothetical protein
MNQKAFLAGICGILLVFVMVFTGCPTGTQEVEGTVNAPSVEAPVVTATPVPGGVKLEWSPIVDVDSYVIWRGTAETENREIESISGTGSYFDKGANKYIYYDLKGYTNDLAAGTEYIYTVVAVSTSKTLTDSRAVVVATPENIPEKGTELAAPTEVTLVLNPDDETITVSWTVGEGIPTNSYEVSIRRDGSDSGLINPSSLSLTSRIYTWDPSKQTDGKYTVRVRANPSSYYKSSVYVASPEVVFETLFSTGNLGSAPSPSAITDTTTTPDTVTGFSATINFSSIVKADTSISYSVERADVDDLGNVGKTFSPVTLSKNSPSGYISAGASDLTPDPVGNLPVSLSDRTLPVKKASYRYRVKATKGNVTQTREYSGNTTVSTDTLLSALGSSVSIGSKTATPVDASITNNSYVVSPYARKGILQAGDKLVIYYVKGNYGVNNNGPYASALIFSKEQLEAATPQTLTISKVTPGDQAAYVEAWWVFADGTQKNITNLTGLGVVDSSSTDSKGNTCGRLDY